MTFRKTPLVNGEYYHVFNRGVAKMPIFKNARDFDRFISSFLYYQLRGPKPKFSNFNSMTDALDYSKKIVEIVAYCVMPNHFHFLIKQIEEGGTSEFISKLSNSYTKYFNTKNKRVGPLLQGEFKSVHIEDHDQLLHVSRYIHLNPIIGYVVSDINLYKYSSYPEYVGLSDHTVCDKAVVMNSFKDLGAYENFVLDQIGYARKLEYIKHLLLDFDESGV